MPVRSWRFCQHDGHRRAGRLRPTACWSALGPPGGGGVWERPAVWAWGAVFWPPALGGAGGLGTPTLPTVLVLGLVGWGCWPLAPLQPHALSCPRAAVHGAAEGLGWVGRLRWGYSAIYSGLPAGR